MLKAFPSGTCQQPLMSRQVSYLTTLNSVYRSETDNKGTPDTAFRLSGYVSIGTRSRLQHQINRKHASSSLSGPTATPAASQGWDLVILTLIHASSWQTNQFVLLWFHYHQASDYIQPELGHEQQHPSDRCSSSSSASSQMHRLYSSATAEEHRKTSQSRLCHTGGGFPGQVGSHLQEQLVVKSDEIKRIVYADDHVVSK